MYDIPELTIDFNVTFDAKGTLYYREAEMTKLRHASNPESKVFL